MKYERIHITGAEAEDGLIVGSLTPPENVGLGTRALVGAGDLRDTYGTWHEKRGTRDTGLGHTDGHGTWTRGLALGFGTGAWHDTALARGMAHLA